MVENQPAFAGTDLQSGFKRIGIVEFVPGRQHRIGAFSSHRIEIRTQGGGRYAPGFRRNLGVRLAFPPFLNGCEVVGHGVQAPLAGLDVPGGQLIVLAFRNHEIVVKDKIIRFLEAGLPIALGRQRVRCLRHDGGREERGRQYGDRPVPDVEAPAFLPELDHDLNGRHVLGGQRFGVELGAIEEDLGISVFGFKPNEGCFSVQFQHHSVRGIRGG